ncbi:MAG: GNAT family N-acetyltransferase [Ginsengibacter sp.]
MLFETDRLYVAKWRKENLNALYDLFNDPAIKELIAPKLTIEETEHIFETQLLDYEKEGVFGRYFIVEKSTGDYIGLLLLKDVNRECSIEIGYSLIREQWKKGYATEVVNETVNWLFTEKGFSNICAITELDNIDSQNVLIKAGFIRQKDILDDGKMMSYFLNSKNEE